MTLLYLAGLSPAQAWQPFEPAAGQPYSRRQAAHLYRRAGFTATSRQLDQATKLGPQDGAKQLLTAPQECAAFDESMRKFALTVIAGNNAETLAAWWLHRMLHSPSPLLEKTTLFWHGHFATSSAKVTDVEVMYRQHQLLRQHALGRFEPLVQGIARDAAMLLYLDSATNRKTHPNENFAREVMELFCLGLGNYTEKDIQELARCFTGWEIQHQQFKFNSYQHDTGSKTVLGKSGKFDGDQAIRVILDQPATARFICGKLVRFFVSDDLELTDELVEPLARQYRENDLTIAPVLQTILSSRLFYSEACVGKKIRSPVEFGIGLLRSLEGTTNLQQITGELRELGQMLFYPPNVKGWNGGLAWINSSTLLGRANLARRLVENGSTRFGGKSLEGYLQGLGWKTSVETVDGLDELLLAVPLSGEVRTQLIADLDRAGPNSPAAIRKLLHTLGSLPEFQLA